jgi:hypothetical protein
LAALLVPQTTAQIARTVETVLIVPRTEQTSGSACLAVTLHRSRSLSYYCFYSSVLVDIVLVDVDVDVAAGIVWGEMTEADYVVREMTTISAMATRRVSVPALVKTAVSIPILILQVMMLLVMMV